MKTDYQYLSFVSVVTRGKTLKWNCLTVKGGICLGLVKWNGGWRLAAILLFYSASRCLQRWLS